jgi:hypothetical protein
MMRVHVVVPTFRESDLVPAFLLSWEGVEDHDVAVYVVNGDPGDRTSELISDWTGRCRVTEIKGSPDLFWTGLVCLGLREVSSAAGPDDLFVLTNIDVSFEGNPLVAIEKGIGPIGKRQITVPVVEEGGRTLSAGVQVRSWALSLNRHLFDGWAFSDIPEDERIAATYLPTRFLVCPVTPLLEGQFPDEAHLPHYCADYEYTNRLRVNGYEPLLFTGASVKIAKENTGFDTYLLETSFLSRLARARDIKCPYHFGYRFQFVRLTYPRWAVIPGMVTHFAKILLEILFGGKRLERLRSR